MAEPYDPLFKLRYGVGSGEKYRQAVQGATPGALPIHSEDDLAREERRTAGYLFAKQHPVIAPIVQPSVDALRTTVFRDDPKVVAAARQGQEAAIGKPGLGSKLARAAIMPSFDTWEDAAAHFFGRK